MTREEQVTVPRQALITVLRAAQWAILWESNGSDLEEVGDLDIVRTALGLGPANNEPNLEIDE